ncbi:MAG: hypothetical protein J0H29_05015 [Sphingobacteriales bacterium]|mgnify:FL=1|nr:hypothetical protein [Sphingobacteriales bacterium]
MNKIRKYGLWGLLFALISCTDLSTICRHGFNNLNGFVYTPSPPRAEELLFRYAVSKNEDGSHTPAAPSEVTRIMWQMLEDVTFIKRFNKDYQMDFLYPVFGNSVKRLSNKELSIKGYMIPLDVKGGLYAISRNPYAACFFCGQSGPESVVSLKFKTKPRRFKTDQFLAVKGIMELNGTNVNDFIYIFRDAEEVK